MLKVKLVVMMDVENNQYLILEDKQKAYIVLLIKKREW